MTNKKKTESAKRDMNFFSEFTSSSGQTGSYVSFILLVLFGLLILGGAIYAVIFLQTTTIKKDINSLNTKMQSETYQAELVAYTDINNNMDTLNQQYYDVSSLFAKVENKEKIDSKYMDTIYDNIPKDVVITGFAYADGTINLSGQCDSYYSPLDMISNFTAAKLFTYVGITDITQVDINSASATTADLALMKKFTFTIQCSLKSNYAVVISKLVDNTVGTPLTAAKSQMLSVGEKYTESGVNTFTDNGKTYTLSRVIINNVLVPEAELATIRQNDSVSGLVTSSVDVKLFYTLSNGGN